METYHNVFAVFGTLDGIQFHLIVVECHEVVCERQICLACECTQRLI